MSTPATTAFTPVLLLLEEGGALRALSAAGTVKAFDNITALNTACSPGKVVVSPPLSGCLSAQVSVAGLPKAHAARDAALLYRLEEHLPWDAERMAAAFIVHPDQALGLAIEHQRLLPQLTELEAAGWQVEAVVPWPLLALAGLPIALKEPKHEPVLVLHDGPTQAWIEHRQGRATCWLHQPDVVAEIAHWTATTGHAPQVAHYGDNSVHTHDPLILAALGAVQTLKSPWDVPGNLRVGPLAKGDTLERLQLPLGLTWLAACLLAIVVLAVAWQRTRTYEAQVNQLKEADRRLYQELYPGETPPMAVGARLDALVKSLPPPGSEADSVLPSVVALFKGLSHAPQLRVDEIQLRPNQLFLSGSAPSASDMAKVADALRGPFQMDTPRIERRSGEQNANGVQFTLAGKPQTKGGLK